MHAKIQKEVKKKKKKKKKKKNQIYLKRYIESK